MDLTIFLSVLQLMFVQIYCIQTLYKFVPEHCEITDVNKSLIHLSLGKCTKHSRELLVLNLNFSLHVDILSDDMGQVKITGYQFRSNEYRMGPIEFMMGVCAFMTSKDFDIPHMLSNSNTRCPFRKGHNYYIYNLTPNATNMPPLIPAGRWMLALDFMYMNKYIMFTVKWFSGVEYFEHFG